MPLLDRTSSHALAREAGVTTHADDDASAISRSLAEPEEFAVIFERHYDEIHRYLRRRHPQEADELAAEVFVSAFALEGRGASVGVHAPPDNVSRRSSTSPLVSV